MSRRCSRVKLYRFTAWFVCCLLACLLLHNNNQQTSSLFALAKEVEVGDDWTLLGDNDTVPSGVHVRMDLSTGQKWVKKVQEEKEEETSNIVTNAAIDSNGGVVLVENDDASGTTAQETPQEDEPTAPSFDYDMMHRTLSQLPEEELERMGGLPELPSTSGATTNIASKTERQEFEGKMKEIWLRRQEELRQFQEEGALADFPQILKVHISSLKGFFSYLETMDEDDKKNKEERMKAVVSVLLDLEYQLSDIDMARDFHTLGGWPLIVQFLSNDSALFNDDSLTQAEQDVVYTVQAHACWVIGTMVKNTAEFYPFSLEHVSDKQETVLSLLIKWFHAETDHGHGFVPCQQAQSNKYQKAMYALGALLRGNRLAQSYFVSEKVQGPDHLAAFLDTAQQACQTESDGCRNGCTKLWKRILLMVYDILMDVELHPSTSGNDSDIVTAFTTETWCDAVMNVVLETTEESPLTDRNANSLLESGVATIQAMLPSNCATVWKSNPQTLTRLKQVKTKLGAMSTEEQSTMEETWNLINSTLDALVGKLDE